MEFVVLGWPPDGPSLRLDYWEFRYAGKFVMTNTGKAIARDPPVDSDDEYRRDFSVDSDDEYRRYVSVDSDDTYRRDVVAAVAFNEDRTDSATAWLRYITVRDDRRGNGIGPKLAAFTTHELDAAGYDGVKIAVNNPYAYRALYRAGFGFTGQETGIAELVLEHPAPEGVEAYRDGLERFAERDDLPTDMRQYVDEHRGGTPPDRLSGVETRD